LGRKFGKFGEFAKSLKKKKKKKKKKPSSIVRFVGFFALKIRKDIEVVEKNIVFRSGLV